MCGAHRLAVSCSGSTRPPLNTSCNCRYARLKHQPRCHQHHHARRLLPRSRNQHPIFARRWTRPPSSSRRIIRVSEGLGFRFEDSPYLAVRMGVRNHIERTSCLPARSALPRERVRSLSGRKVSVGPRRDLSISCTMNLKLLGVEKIWVKALSRTHHQIFARLVPTVSLSLNMKSGSTSHRCSTIR